MKPAQTKLPRWRGFNLHYFFGGWNNNIPVEGDFRIASELGFDFVRLPMWYTNWTEPGDPYKVKEEILINIDQAVAWGGQHGHHVCLNFHRAPGYCVAKEPAEPFDLWKDQEALDAFCFQWDLFAKRYKDIPGNALSFNLVNEPVTKRKTHERVVRTVVKTIRAVREDRLIIADGLMWGRLPLPELADLGIAQSCRGYDPFKLTHYKASWAEGADKFPLPEWPGGEEGGKPWNRARLEEHYAPWAALARQGVGIHCGECGCYNKTPHPVMLAWLRDLLDMLKGLGIGYALWEFRGGFGFLNSQREDVDYEDWKGYEVDRKMMDLVRGF